MVLAPSPGLIAISIEDGLELPVGPFYSFCSSLLPPSSALIRLLSPNGNTLSTESDKGEGILTWLKVRL